LRPRPQPAGEATETAAAAPEHDRDRGEQDEERGQDEIEPRNRGHPPSAAYYAFCGVSPTWSSARRVHERKIAELTAVAAPRPSTSPMTGERPSAGAIVRPAHAAGPARSR